MVVGIDDVLSITGQKYKTSFKEVQFQSALRVIMMYLFSLFRQGIS